MRYHPLLPLNSAKKHDAKLRSEPKPEKEVVEGKARLTLPAQTSNRVFYNPKMNLNRDLGVLFASSYFPTSRHVRVCDSMTGSGIRAIRYALECRNFRDILAADSEAEAAECARANVRRNGLEGVIQIVESDATLLLLNHTRERFDLIDIDPFGSPAPYFEAALRATSEGGVIAATATDMGPLTGARAAACYRKYGVRPLRSEFEKETAVRTLVACLATIACRLELGISIAFSHATDHYARIYASIIKGKKASNLSARSLGFLEYCPKCLRRAPRRSLEHLENVCVDCGTRSVLAGPFWLGPIWDVALVDRMIQHTPTLQSSRLSEIQKILQYISDEQTAPAFHYRTDRFAETLGIKPPALNRLLSSLQDRGFRATRTHFHPNGFRTDANIREIGETISTLIQKT